MILYDVTIPNVALTMKLSFHLLYFSYFVLYFGFGCLLCVTHMKFVTLVYLDYGFQSLLEFHLFSMILQPFPKLVGHNFINKFGGSRTWTLSPTTCYQPHGVRTSKDGHTAPLEGLLRFWEMFRSSSPRKFEHLEYTLT